MLKLISKEDEAKALDLKAQANKAFAGKPLIHKPLNIPRTWMRC